MILNDAINLINHTAIAEKENARWADLGCGAGTFTYALANILQKGSSILAVDKSAITLNPQTNPNNVAIQTKQIDFIKNSLPIDDLNGILMANSLHYVADKLNFIINTGKKLTADGIFLIVEYDTDKPNPWVPYPASSNSLQSIFAKAGYHSFTKLRSLPSLYNSGKMYAAIISK